MWGSEGNKYDDDHSGVQCGDCRHFTVTGVQPTTATADGGVTTTTAARPVGSQSFIFTRLSDGYHLSIIIITHTTASRS